jgi:DNA repair photolyase
MPAFRRPARHALLRADLPDNFSHALYPIAPSKGCAHGCRYCDGRAEKYYVEGSFEEDIEIREGIPELLERELALLRERGIIAFGSGVTDPYQPCEARERLTGSCASILADHRNQAGGNEDLFSQPGTEGLGMPETGMPALVMTKSALVLRDIEHWKRVNEKAGFILLVSLTSLDEGLRELMEPGASPFAERIKALRAFKAAGCSVGVLAMPFLPGLSDGEESISRLYAACADAKVDFVMPGGLTLRPGRQKELFEKTIAENHPELSERIREMYKENRASGIPLATQVRALEARISPIRRSSGLPWLLPHRIYSRLLPAHDSIRILLRDMIELYGARGVDIAELRASAERYDGWLLEKRRGFRRKRRLPSEWLEEVIPTALASGELGRRIENPRLLSFINTIIAEKAYFDYMSLKLES